MTAEELRQLGEEIVDSLLENMNAALEEQKRKIKEIPN